MVAFGHIVGGVDFRVIMVSFLCLVILFIVLGVVSCMSVAMKHGLSWQTASLLHLIGLDGKRIVEIANTK